MALKLKIKEYYERAKSSKRFLLLIWLWPLKYVWIVSAAYFIYIIKIISGGQDINLINIIGVLITLAVNIIILFLFIGWLIVNWKEIRYGKEGRNNG